MRYLRFAIVVLTAAWAAGVTDVVTMDVVITSRDGVKLEGTYCSPGTPGPGVVRELRPAIVKWLQSVMK
jgi:hypothetical protein